MIVTLDPRAIDHPHSLEQHRPDLPGDTSGPRTDLQVDGEWSYAADPGGWAAPAPVPELSTCVMLAVGFTLLFSLGLSRRRDRII